MRVPSHEPPSLGPRGEGWLALQTLLAVAVGLSALTGVEWPSAAAGALEVGGGILCTLGLAAILAGALMLGESFTPLPRPREGGGLQARGLYRLVRHPMYGGMLALALGWSLATAPLGLLPTLGFAIVLDLKARREEAWLVALYPGYDHYRRHVRWRFVPGLR